MDALELYMRHTTGPGSKIVVEKIFCAIMGSLTGGVFLSRLVYWHNKGGRSDGFFYKGASEWEREVYISRYYVKKHSAELEEMGLLETKLTNANGAPTYHFRFKFSLFVQMVGEWLRQNNVTINNKSDIDNFDFQIFEIRFSNISKSITMNTTKELLRNSCNGQKSDEKEKIQEKESDSKEVQRPVKRKMSDLERIKTELFDFFVDEALIVNPPSSESARAATYYKQIQSLYGYYRPKRDGEKVKYTYDKNTINRCKKALKWAINKMNEDGLSIKSIKSVEFLLREYLIKERDGQLGQGDPTRLLT